MYPYFIVGYLWNKYQFYNRIKCLFFTLKLAVLIVLVAVYAFLFASFSKELYVYTSETCILKANGNECMLSLHQLFVDFYRYIIGFVGSACVMLSVKMAVESLRRKHVLLKKIYVVVSKIGKKSIGIYLISTMFINVPILALLPHHDELGYGTVLLETILIVIFTYMLTILIEKNSIMRKLLLGAR